MCIMLTAVCNYMRYKPHVIRQSKTRICNPQNMDFQPQHFRFLAERFITNDSLEGNVVYIRRAGDSAGNVVVSEAPITR